MLFLSLSLSEMLICIMTFFIAVEEETIPGFKKKKRKKEEAASASPGACCPPTGFSNEAATAPDRLRPRVLARGLPDAVGGSVGELLRGGSTVTPSCSVAGQEVTVTHSLALEPRTGGERLPGQMALPPRCAALRGHDSTVAATPPTSALFLLDADGMVGRGEWWAEG